jgi:hypothetical protein
MFRVEMLPANHGDCLWIEYGTGRSPHRVLIDGGPPYAYDRLKARIPGPGSHFDLLTITHVDFDHIGGDLELLIEMPEAVSFDDVWFNAWHHLPGPRDTLGALDGELMSVVIEKRKLSWNQAFKGKAVATEEKDRLPRISLSGDMELILLGPTTHALCDLRPKWASTVREHGLDPGNRAAALKQLRERKDLPRDLLGDDVPDPAKLVRRQPTEDDSLPNASSIAFVADYNGTRVLFTGDAHPSDLVTAVKRLCQEEGTNRLELAAAKLSHHGSSGSISDALIQSLDCPNYLVSTNGRIYGHPKQDAIARVVVYGGDGVKLHFNYETTQTAVWKDRSLRRRFKYEPVYPEATNGGASLNL